MDEHKGAVKSRAGNTSLDRRHFPLRFIDRLDVESNSFYYERLNFLEGKEFRDNQVDGNSAKPSLIR